MKCSNCGTDNSEEMRFCGECGAMLAQPMQYQQVQAPSRGPPYKLRVNLLCLLGAVIAVVALFLPWAMTPDHLGEEIGIGAFDFDEPLSGGSEFPDSFRYSVTLFIIGTVLSFLTPLGGIPQIVGSVGFVSTVLTSRIPEHDLIPGIGVVIALLAAGIVILSFLEPVGTGYSRNQEPTLAAKLLTWSAYR